MSTAFRTAIVLAACLTPAYRAAAAEQVVQPFEGVRYITRTQSVPRLLSIHILEVDLDAPGISFRVTPSNKHLIGETTRQTTLQYLTEQNAQAAINGDFFSTDGAGANQTTMNASDGDIYSVWGAAGTRPAMNITRDNVANVVIRQPGGSDKTPMPNVPIYNALGGDEWILKDGVVNTADTTLAPRTATGVTGDGRLLMLVVDGRQSDLSLGMSKADVARVLQSYGAVNAVNHDGGGSTTMVLADTAPRVVNSPSDGSLRSVGNNLALFANAAQQRVDTVVFSDFYAGDAGTFRYSPGTSGSTIGIDESASTAQATADPTATRGWSQRLMIEADATGDDAWIVRHISGANASRSENLARATTGSVGFWAKTSDRGVSAALAIDDASNTTADRGVIRSLIADGEWHLYEWDLEDDAQWEAWANGDGVIDTASFTLDSIQFFGNGDATIDIDAVAHNALGSLAVPEPAAGAILLSAFGGLALHRSRDARRGG